MNPVHASTLPGFAASGLTAATLRSQEQYRHLPLIVLTSRAATKHHQRAFQLGADAYLVKPYQDEELLSTLARLTKPAN